MHSTHEQQFSYISHFLFCSPILCHCHCYLLPYPKQLVSTSQISKIHKTNSTFRPAIFCTDRIYYSNGFSKIILTCCQPAFKTQEMPISLFGNAINSIKPNLASQQERWPPYKLQIRISPVWNKHQIHLPGISTVICSWSRENLMTKQFHIINF